MYVDSYFGAPCAELCEATQNKLALNDVEATTLLLRYAILTLHESAVKSLRRRRRSPTTLPSSFRRDEDREDARRWDARAREGGRFGVYKKHKIKFRSPRVRNIRALVIRRPGWGNVRSLLSNGV